MYPSFFESNLADAVSSLATEDRMISESSLADELVLLLRFDMTLTLIVESAFRSMDRVGTFDVIKVAIVCYSI